MGTRSATTSGSRRRTTRRPPRTPRAASRRPWRSWRPCRISCMGTSTQRGRNSDSRFTNKLYYERMTPDQNAQQPCSAMLLRETCSPALQSLDTLQFFPSAHEAPHSPPHWMSVLSQTRRAPSNNEHPGRSWATQQFCHEKELCRILTGWSTYLQRPADETTHSMQVPPAFVWAQSASLSHEVTHVPSAPH